MPLFVIRGALRVKFPDIAPKLRNNSAGSQSVKMD